MLLAYAFCFGPGMNAPELCLIPDKPDGFSCPVRVEALIETNAAILRLSPTEGAKIRTDSDGGIIVEPTVPSKLYITPSQPDRPGVAVKSIKALKSKDGVWSTFFKEDGGREMEWKPWRPNEVQ